MGRERFDSVAYAATATSRSYATKSREQIFTSRTKPTALDPAKIIVRESCDSEANPLSTPLIFGLDVTGSMGFIAEDIAKTRLPKLFESIYADKPVTDPHVMFMGIGDINHDSAPLQVSQFEAGATAIIDQLTSLWLESGGGGNDYESYDLPWYFAAHKTVIDSFTKRGVKGYIFTIGDELPPQHSLGSLSKSTLTECFGKQNSMPPPPQSTQLLLEEVKQRYKVFHIIAEEGNYARFRRDTVREEWTKLLGANAIFMKNHEDLPMIVTALLQIDNGADMNAVINASNTPDVLRYAFHNAIVANG